MMKISVSELFFKEKKYTIDVLLGSFLDIEYVIEKEDFNEKSSGRYKITLENGNEIIFRDNFFDLFIKNKDYLKVENIPNTVEYTTNQFLVEKDIPIIYGDKLLEISENKVVCGIDIFASSFFMLTRWEEHVNTIRDNHIRFPAIASLAYKSDFLIRPVVNEYLEMFWNMLVFLGYRGQRKERQFEFKVSHDVDSIFKYYFRSPLWAGKIFTYLLIKEKNPVKASHVPFQYIAAKYNPEKYDPYYNYDLIMDLSEKNNLRSAFYFIADHSEEKMDGDYDVFHPLVQKTMKHIDERGHEVGLHGSYNSYNSKKQYQKEWLRLLDSCQQSGLKQKIRGSRQHNLRWATPHSFSVINATGVEYDTTLSYADHVGFRCGTCYEYPVFDILKRKKLQLKERPLILMECSLLDGRYMNKNSNEALEIAIELKKKIKRYGGLFSMLWHNARFLDTAEIDLYKQILIT